eukprot:1195303-Prorocentrum_minimum.AAC.9
MQFAGCAAVRSRGPLACRNPPRPPDPLRLPTASLPRVQAHHGGARPEPSTRVGSFDHVATSRLTVRLSDCQTVRLPDRRARVHPRWI